VFVAMFGICAGMGVIWFVVQIYTLVFLTRVLKMDPQTASLVLTVSLLIGMPFYLVVGRLSDCVGRKPVIVSGCVAALLTIFPIFKGITHFTNPALERAQAVSPVVVVADPDECPFQFNPIGISTFISSCDIAKSALVRRGIPYSNQTAAPGEIARIRVGAATVASYDAKAPDVSERAARFNQSIVSVLRDAQYPSSADPAEINYVMLTLLISLLVIYAATAYSRTAAALVELFPTRIRYTSVSLPYHLGVGWFGGLLPATVVAISNRQHLRRLMVPRGNYRR